MRKLIFYVGIAFTAIGQIALGIAEFGLWIYLLVLLFSAGSFFWGLMWLVFGFTLLALVFAAIRLPVAGIGLLIIKLSGYGDDEEQHRLRVDEHLACVNAERLEGMKDQVRQADRLAMNRIVRHRRAAFTDDESARDDAEQILEDYQESLDAVLQGYFNDMAATGPGAESVRAMADWLIESGSRLDSIWETHVFHDEPGLIEALAQEVGNS
ncbi:MAG: hypothetical protein R3C29_07885 [Dehalococcoidia bacterium]